VADEQDTVTVAQDALDAARVRPPHEPPRAQRGVRGPVAEALQRDPARAAQPFGAIA
jgi:hypothetical protein